MEVHRVKQSQPLAEPFVTDDFVEASAPASSSQPSTQDEYDECILRILQPSKDHQNRNQKRASKPDDENNEDYDSDNDFLDPRSEAFALAEFEDGEEWKTKYRLSVTDIALKGINKSGEVSLQFRADKNVAMTREFVFPTVEEAEEFGRILEESLAKERENTARKFHATSGELESMGLTELKILVEIVSAWDLPAGDLNSSDPYVQCFLNGEKVHETKFISKK